MKRRTFISALVVAVTLAGFAPSLAHAGDGFLSGFEDLPLMSGLSEVPDSVISFDTPAGRILEAYAAGQTTPKKVTTFYAQTLPQLGWSKTSATTFQREGEKLAIDITGSGKSLTVRFTLSPL